MSRSIYRIGGSILALIAVLALGACDDDPVGSEDEHEDPVGMVISAGGVDLVTVNGSVVTGTLTVDAGQETAHLDVEFLDADGDRFTPDDADEWLQVIIQNPAVADWEQDEPGEFGGHLRGLTAGTTVAGFDLMHGAVGSASAHPDYRSPSIPVVIN